MPQTAVTTADLTQRIAARAARVGIVGQGYVGLPLAVEFAESDCVLILTGHPEFDYAGIVETSALVVDNRATHVLTVPADRVVAL
jgi:UDP-N-acetyl-D-mannosaminuronate dehydrogenase